ncbi:MAG: YceI family protein [Cyclobacteriaceae bacterium]|nr:YceI family protein [Cyclobacteriaceae bacterium]
MNIYFNQLLFSLVLLLTVLPAVSQKKLKLENCEVSFFSEAPLENIEAYNKESMGIIDWEANTFLFRVPIKGFVFDKSLMQSHFNENYMESDEFPNASFKGTIEGNYNLKTNGTYNVTAVGELEIHGVKQQRRIEATIAVKNQQISISSKFNVKLEDHGIEIPTIVFNKIAEVVEVTITSETGVK